MFTEYDAIPLFDTEISVFLLRRNGQWTLLLPENLPPFHHENTPIQIYWKFYNQNQKNFR